MGHIDEDTIDNIARNSQQHSRMRLDLKQELMNDSFSHSSRMLKQQFESYCVKREHAHNKSDSFYRILAVHIQGEISY